MRTSRIVDTDEMKARQDLRIIHQVLERFRQDHGRYPAQSESLDVLVDSSPGGQYLVSRHAITDPWGNAFVYRAPDPSQKIPPVIYSRGPNGIDEGGHGDDILP